MSISKKNLKLINSLEKTLKEQLFWLSRNGMQISLDAIESLRNLRQFIIGLSVAIIGIVFPLMLANDLIKENDFFIISLVCFSYVVIYGIFDLIISRSRELVDIPSAVESNLKKLMKLIKEIQDIRKIENNDEAGIKYEQLKSSYTQKFPSDKLSFFQKLWRKYENSFFFSFFIVGYIFLVLGFLMN